MEYIEFLENENQRLTNLCDQYFRVLAYLSDQQGELRIPQEMFICHKDDLPKMKTHTDHEKFEYVIKGGNE
jgi:hypothetical protein